MPSKLQSVTLLACIVIGTAFAAAAPSWIGTATVRGEMRVDSYTVGGNATLMNGSVVETGNAAAELRLGAGIDVRLGANARGTVFGDHLVLERGAAQVTGSYRIQVGSLAVTPKQSGSSGVVALNGGQLQVAAVTGELAILNARGTLLASVEPGKAMSFAMEPAAGGGNGQGGAGTEGSLVPLYIGVAGMLVGLGTALGIGIESSPAASR